MKTLVLGASLNESRYSNKAIRLLKQYGHEVIAVGRDKGNVAAVSIQNRFPENALIDTITLYLNPGLQKAYYEDIWNTRPRRIIFNPGTENPELREQAVQRGILCEEACTLVLLNTNQY
ncbi:MAG: CoA-binding protein [Bacteroidetes bacterium]|nr:CoA-binding protein [Bacteroidota bacterium]MBK8658931.1 CoA-binding protein [Bacteroidota bacterium]